MKRTTDSLLGSAQKLAAQFKKAHPNRTFEVIEKSESSVDIAIKDSFVSVSLSIQNYAVRMQMGAKIGTYTMGNARTHLSKFFAAEKDLRHRHRHARQAMREHIAKLETAELLFANESQIIQFTMDGFSGNRRACPSINIAFKEIPDRPFAQIIYNNYHNDVAAGARRGTNYSVLFGDGWHHFDSFKDVFAYFDDAQVLRQLDSLDAQKLLSLIPLNVDRTNDRHQGRAVFKAEDLELLAPYLLVMEPRGFQIHQAKVRQVPIVDADIGIQDAARPLYFKEDDAQLYSCFAFTELAWDGSL